MWFAYLYRRGTNASSWVPDPDEVAAATTEAECITGILEAPWDATYELGVDPLPSQIADIRAQVVAPVPRLFARIDTADWTGQTYEYVGVQEDPAAPVPLPPNPLPREPLEEHSVHAIHLLPPVGTSGQLLALNASQELSWLTPGTVALEDGSVTTAKLAPNAVTTDKIADGTITGADLAAGTITADKLAGGVLPAAPPNASDTVRGLIQIATTAEVQAGTDTLKAVTPGRLVSRTATETSTGLVELATTAEAVAGTDTVRAVTPAGLAARIAALPTIPAASEATPGILSLATQAEVTTGTDDTKALTPLKLATRLVNASETQRGLLELATQAETTAGTNDLTAVSPLKLQQKLTAVLPGAASETTAGLVELATSAETTTGTDTTRAVTPAGLAARLPSGTPLSLTRYAASGTTLETAPGLLTAAGGSLGIGTTPGQALHLAGETVSAAGLQQDLYLTSASGPSQTGRHARGTLAAPARVVAGDVLLSFQAQGWARDLGDTTDTWFLGGRMQLLADTADAQGRIGGGLRLFLAPGAGQPVGETLRVTQASNLLLGTTTHGTDLSKGLVLGSGTAPTASHPADAVQVWSGDTGGGAGKAGLHVRTEDGTSHVLGDVSGIGTLCNAALGGGVTYRRLNVFAGQLFVRTSSTQERGVAAMDVSFPVSTDASRTGRLWFSVMDAAGSRETLRMEADGSAARLSFFGAAAVARPTVNAAATDATTTQALANSLRTALVNLGLCA